MCSGIWYIYSDNPVTVYNFEVADFHTYFVGDDSLLVHNKGCSTKNATKLWDIKKFSKGKPLSFSFQGKKMTAYFDGRYYWAKDLAGHGGSAYKVYRKSGKQLIWYTDADIYGNFISDKYKGGIGRIINL